jgi:hypothetical protein
LKIRRFGRADRRFLLLQQGFVGIGSDLHQQVDPCSPAHHQSPGAR